MQKAGADFVRSTPKSEHTRRRTHKEFSVDCAVPCFLHVQTLRSVHRRNRNPQPFSHSCRPPPSTAPRSLRRNLVNSFLHKTVIFSPIVFWFCLCYTVYKQDFKFLIISFIFKPPMRLSRNSLLKDPINQAGRRGFLPVDFTEKEGKE